MKKAVWRLTLNSITTAIILAAFGNPLVDTMAVLVAYALFLWLQEEIIELIRERGGKSDRSERAASGRCRKSA